MCACAESVSSEIRVFSESNRFLLVFPVSSDSLCSVCAIYYAEIMAINVVFVLFRLVLYGYKNKLSLGDCWALSRWLTSRSQVDGLDKAWQEQVEIANQINSQSRSGTESSFVNPAFESAAPSEASDLISSASTDSMKLVQPSLFRAFLRVFLPRFLLSTAFNLVYDAATLIQPILLK